MLLGRVLKEREIVLFSMGGNGKSEATIKKRFWGYASCLIEEDKQ